jgi:hypothetical protein
LTSTNPLPLVVFYAVCLGILCYLRLSIPETDNLENPSIKSSGNHSSPVEDHRTLDRSSRPTEAMISPVPSPLHQVSQPGLWWHGTSVPADPTSPIATESTMNQSRPPSVVPSARISRQQFASNPRVSLPPSVLSAERRPRPPSSLRLTRSSQQWKPTDPGSGDRMSHLSQLVILSAAVRSDTESSVALPSPIEESRRKRLTKSRLDFNPV